MKRVLVTGGGGFVGSHIVRLLHLRGVECLVVGRNRYPEIEALGVQCLQGDICDPLFLLDCCREVDTVFHVAALAGIWGKWDDFYRINVLGTENVLTACRKNKIRHLIYTSTPSVVFNGKDIVNGDERLPYADRFLCHYARSKVMAEKMVLAGAGEELLTCAIRPHLVWGPGDPHLIPRLLERGRQRQLKKVGDCTNMVDISYVENVGEAHLLAAQNLESTGNASGQAYFISQGEPVNLWQWIDELFKRMDVPPVQSRVPFSLAYAAGTLLEGLHSIFAPTKEPRMTRFLAEQLAKSHCFSIAKAQQDLGYHARISTEEGMERLCRSM
ncbi:MAG: NAD-dependent epimerase/dehydratase family protein [Proteobacteria bacterium]|nr:NAD-dependent epimerase/dehydratase family protein [Pseudomonadota bacterium]MBU1420481.1 NAD-dependent epimerase/dehydratase family protein [Pseudomonadota bacterium]MBU1456044.1 NAD-dependent epimerase/dehydratase family protein [Pseudomonadota bacterium]